MTNAPCAIVLLPHPAPLVLIDGDQSALIVLSQAEEPVQVGWVKSPLEPALGIINFLVSPSYSYPPSHSVINPHSQLVPDSEASVPGNHFSID